MTDLKVVPLKKAGESEASPEKVLNRALEASLDAVIVIGERLSEDGEKILYLATSEEVGPMELNWLLDLSKQVNLLGYID